MYDVSVNALGILFDVLFTLAIVVVLAMIIRGQLPQCPRWVAGLVGFALVFVFVGVLVALANATKPTGSGGKLAVFVLISVLLGAALMVGTRLAARWLAEYLNRR